MMKRYLFLKQAGLTLLEILVVLLIVALLAGYIGPKVFSRVDLPKDKEALAHMRVIAEALDRFHQDKQRYPTSDEGLAVLVEKLANNDASWKEPYLTKSFLYDPWGNPYIYHVPGKEKGYDLFSFGADGKPEGKGENADIIY